MGKSIGLDNDFHFETLPKETKVALDFIASLEWFKDFNFYLAEGTSLALQTGNRKSVDLDFFTTDKHFDNKTILEKLGDKGVLEVDINKDNTVYITLFGAKVSFIAYPFFVPKCDFLDYGSVRILDKKDVAVMKIVAVSQRGKKRDFFDLYWYIKNIEPLEEVLKRLPNQYPVVAHDYNHILKSMMYFADAEDDSDPEINFEASWKGVKEFFDKEIPKVIKSLMDLN